MAPGVRVVPLLLAGLVLAGCLRLGVRPVVLPEVAPAPAIEGTDADGRPLRLADQRGKVVLLSFWHQG